jgi:MFS family permease
MSDPATTPPASSRNAQLIVFLVVFVDLLGFGIVLPLLPLYGDTYVAAIIPGGKENRAGGAILGVLMASFSLMQFVFAPVWGRISDRIGRRPILLLGLAGSVLFYSLFGYASELPPQTQAPLALALLFVARIGAGIAGATISTAQAVIADTTTPEKRRHGMALIGAAFGIGFTFGPLLGFLSLGWLPAHLGPAMEKIGLPGWFHDEYAVKGLTGYTAAFLSLVALLLGLRLLPETRTPGGAARDRKWFDFQAIRMVLRTPAIAPVVLTFFLATLGFGAFEVTLALLNKDALGLDEKNNFLIFAYVGLTLLIAQGLIYRRIAKRLTEPPLMAIGIVLMGLGVLSLGGVSWSASTHYLEGEALLPWMLGALTLAVVGFALLTPSAQALVSRRSDPARQGEVLGVNQSASALARILGPIFGLTLYKLTDTHMLPYFFGAALLALMLPLMPRIRRG